MRSSSAPDSKSVLILSQGLLAEEKATKENFGTLKSDPMGKLHEVLVGYHLRGGKHMDKHHDAEGKSPKEVHDEIAAKIGGVKSLQYKNFSERARKAAEHIKEHLGLGPDDIKHVQWTSKAGDMERATGIKASQKEDDSDVVITDKNGRHHGVSLKVSNDNKPITLSNNGTETTYGGTQSITTSSPFNWTNLDGLVTFTNVTTSSGTTFIDGGNIKAATITVDKLTAGLLKIGRAHV